MPVAEQGQRAFRADILTGHYSAQDLKAQWQKTVMGWTIFREPWSRLLSTFHFTQANWPITPRGVSVEMLERIAWHMKLRSKDAEATSTAVHMAYHYATDRDSEQIMSNMTT